jgi:hypothetical protein
MSKRFGRNRKRALQLQLQKERSELANLRRYHTDKQQRDYELHDIGLRTYIYNKLDRGELDIRASIGEFNMLRVVTMHEIQSARSPREIINHVAQCIANDLIKYIGSKITYV